MLRCQSPCRVSVKGTYLFVCFHCDFIVVHYIPFSSFAPSPLSIAPDSLPSKHTVSYWCCRNVDISNVWVRSVHEDSSDRNPPSSLPSTLPTSFSPRFDDETVAVNVILAPWVIQQVVLDSNLGFFTVIVITEATAAAAANAAGATQNGSLHFRAGTLRAVAQPYHDALDKQFC